MKNLLTLLLISLLPIVSFSQGKNDDLLKDKDYLKYEEEALELYSSLAYQIHSESFLEFVTGLGKADFDFETTDFMKWLNENFEKTNFKSKEEAVFYYTKYKTAATDELKNKIIEVDKHGYSLRVKYGEEIIDNALQNIIIKAFKTDN